MTLDETINQIVNSIGRLEKERVLLENKDNIMLREYLKLVYDPSINYNMTKLPTVYMHGSLELSTEIARNIKTVLANTRGNAAREFITDELHSLTVESHGLVANMINRSIGGSVGETMVLKTWPDLFFIPPYQRCSLLDEKATLKLQNQEVILQPKLDGSFAYLKVDSESVVMTRNGNFYPSWFCDMLTEGLSVSNVVFIGELLVKKDGVTLDRQTGNGILNKILKGESQELFDHLSFTINCWDIITPEDFKRGFSHYVYKDRLSKLTSVASGNVVLVDSKTCSFEEALTYHQEHLKQGLEGSVVKTKNFIWKDHTSKDMFKLKVKFECDMIVTGYYEGEGNASGSLGGLSISSSDQTIACNVGSGFTKAQREEMWGNRDSLTGLIVTITANDIVKDKRTGASSLFLPIFVEVRYDKTEADSSSHIEAQLKNARR